MTEPKRVRLYVSIDLTHVELVDGFVAALRAQARRDGRPRPKRERILGCLIECVLQEDPLVLALLKESWARSATLALRRSPRGRRSPKTAKPPRAAADAGAAAAAPPAPGTPPPAPRR